MPRPPILRVLSVLSIILPPILYLISFAFSLKTIYEPAFAVSDVYNSSFLPAPEHHPYTYKRAPFYVCSDNLNGSNPLQDYINGFNQTCTRINGLGSKGMHFCESINTLSEHLCQKIVISAQLYVAGVVFISIAMLIAVIVATLSWKAAVSSTSVAYSRVAGGEDESAPKGPPILAPSLKAFSILLAILATIALAIAQVIGVNGLVDTQEPSGEDSIPNFQPSSVYQGSWYMGRGSLIYATVAWLAALLGAFGAASGFGVNGL